MNPLITEGLWETMKKAVQNKDLSAVLDIAVLLQDGAPQKTIQAGPQLVPITKDTAAPQSENSSPSGIVYTRRTLREVEEVRRNLRGLLLNTIFPEFAVEQGLGFFTKASITKEFEKRGITVSELDYTLIPPILRTEFQEMGILKCVTTKTVQFTPEYIKSVTEENSGWREPEVNDVEMQVCLLYERTLLPNLLKSNNYYKTYPIDTLVDCFDYDHPSLGDFPVEDHLEEILLYLKTKNLLEYNEKEGWFTVTSKACNTPLLIEDEVTPSIYATVDDVHNMLQTNGSRESN
jgi:hypothetical protein